MSEDDDKHISLAAPVFYLLIGAAVLFYKKYISWHIPFTYIGTVALLTWMFGGQSGLFAGDPIFHVLSGGLILGALRGRQSMNDGRLPMEDRIP